ncbi:MAG TPA: DUF4394 domain-containing protein [Chthoniobacterales bacterium]|jgi:hypothetical protein|nr:DUF4394 domain-containing protein [Chthoniobacterales bacterium]
MKKVHLAIVYLLSAAVMPCSGETIVALYSNYRLRSFDSAAPGTFTKTVDMTGIPTDEALVAMDFDPKAGDLYVLTRKDMSVRFYRVDPATGAATAGQASGSWSGTSFGFEAAPISIGPAGTVIADDADRLRRSDFDSSFSAPDTMSYDNSTSDGDPVDQHAGDNPAITALAFSNNFPGAKSAVLYGIDAAPDSLVVVNYSTGELNTVGPLGAATGTRCGFDISGATGTAYAALSSGEGTTLYTVNLGTGTATNVGVIGGQFQQIGVTLVDISVVLPTRLLNIATRTRVGTGEDVMIAGFTISGGATSRLLIRGLGPSLAAFGIASPLPNPFLTVFDAQGAIASNDNWRSNQQSEISSTFLAPSNDLEAAYVGNFAPGAYTAILRDANDATGVGIIEVYKLSDQ